jgi:hypothetical protein
MNKQTTFVGIMGILVLSALMYIVYKETEPRPSTNKITITRTNEDVDGRPLFILEMNGEVEEQVYAEEIGMSLLRDSIILDEMIQFKEDL